MVPDIYQLGLKLSQEDHIWSCTPGARAETPTGDELYYRKKDPFQLENVIGDEGKVANDLWLQLRDTLLGLKVS